MRFVTPLLAVPVIIGLIAGIAGFGDRIVPILVSLLKIGEWVLGILIVCKIIGFSLPSAPAQPSKPELLHPQRDTPLENGSFEYVDKHTRILHADGYAFELTNRFNGRLHWREVDPASKQPLERWVTSHERHAAYLGQDRIAREDIMTKVNKRKGL